MRTKILLFGLLVLAAGCDSGSSDQAKVAGVVEERNAAVAAALAAIPVPPGATPSLDTSTARTFSLPDALSVDDAHAFFSDRLPEESALEGWSWCDKRQDDLGITWRWHRSDDSVSRTVSVDLGRDDRTGEGYVLIVARSGSAPTCDAG
ncbi:MAG: hypothetical protein ACRD0C_03310 [Acidimicrobiia bacterium]